MNNIKAFLRKHLNVERHIICFVIGVCFLTWAFLFRNFIFGKYFFYDDAISYFDHIKFFIVNISKGVYPLWDPNWNCGVPNEFFLRRIGCFNPFLLVIVVFYKFGMSYLLSYNFFLVGYFFLAMIGFFKLSNLIFKNSKLALVSFVLLLFSSISTVLYSSFIILIITPIIWFFYFLFLFSEHKNRYSVLGLTFCLMILASTYVPFYFITLFFIVVICSLLLYFKRTINFVIDAITFVKSNKVVSLMCFMCIFLSVIPSILLFLDARSGELVFSVRHNISSNSNALSVAEQSIGVHGVYLDAAAGDILSNLNKIKLGEFFLPVFCYMLFMLSFVTKISRRALLLILMWFLTYIISVYDASTVYKVLYDRIFYFRYFRNFQFFVWIGLIPVFILFCVEQLRGLLSMRNFDKSKMILTIAIVNIVFVLWLIKSTNIIVSVFMTLLFGSYFLTIVKKNDNFSNGILMLIIFCSILNPIETFYYLNNNYTSLSVLGKYDIAENGFSFNRDNGEFSEVRIRDVNSYLRNNKLVAPVLYYSSKEISELVYKLDYRNFINYSRNRIMTYDNVYLLPQSGQMIDALSKTFSSNQNVAFIYRPVVSSLINGKENLDLSINQIIDRNQIQIEKFDANSIEINTSFDKEKFLVFNDSFNKRWQVFVDGNKKDVIQANYGFMGVFVPSGNHSVFFRYGSLNYYLLNLCGHVVFMIMFLSLLISYIKSRKSLSY